MSKLLILLGVLASTSALFGCSMGGRIRETEEAPPEFVNGTHLLAEVQSVYTREAIINPERNWTHIFGWRDLLLSSGYKDADIKDGSEVSVVTFCYAHNSQSHCRHQGFYYAHVDPGLQGSLTTQMKNDERTRKTGDLVEVELRESPSTKLLTGIVVAVYRKADDWGSCRWEHLNYAGLSSYSPLGPPVGVWLDCDDLEKEGWIKRHVRGSPPSGPSGAPDRDVHEWIKLPTK